MKSARLVEERVEPFVRQRAHPLERRQRAVHVDDALLVVPAPVDALSVAATVRRLAGAPKLAHVHDLKAPAPEADQASSSRIGASTVRPNFESMSVNA